MRMRALATARRRGRARGGSGRRRPRSCRPRPTRAPRSRRASTTPASRRRAWSCSPTVNKPPGWSNPANPGDFAFAQLRHRVPGQLRVLRQLQRLQRSSTSPTRRRRRSRPSVRLPGRPGRRLGLQEPAVHVGRGDAREEGLHARPRRRTRRRASAASASSTSRTSTAPVQVGQVQTCRGSHTHTLVRPKNDANNVYIYVSGTAGAAQRGRARGLRRQQHERRRRATNPSKWRIEVIKVPLAAPATAAIVSSRGCSRNEAGAVNGLQNAPQTPTTRARESPNAGVRLATDAAPAATGSPADHGRLPRHHGLREVRPGRRLLRGQRPADRHLRPGEPEAHRRRRRPAVRLLARRDVLQRRQEGLLHRRVGRRHERRAAARPTS